MGYESEKPAEQKARVKFRGYDQDFKTLSEVSGQPGRKGRVQFKGYEAEQKPAVRFRGYEAEQAARKGGVRFRGYESEEAARPGAKVRFLGYDPVEQRRLIEEAVIARDVDNLERQGYSLGAGDIENVQSQARAEANQAMQLPPQEKYNYLEDLEMDMRNFEMMTGRGEPLLLDAPREPILLPYPDILKGANFMLFPTEDGGETKKIIRDYSQLILENLQNLQESISENEMRLIISRALSSDEEEEEEMKGEVRKSPVSAVSSHLESIIQQKVESGESVTTRDIQEASEDLVDRINDEIETSSAAREIDQPPEFEPEVVGTYQSPEMEVMEEEEEEEEEEEKAEEEEEEVRTTSRVSPEVFEEKAEEEEEEKEEGVLTLIVPDKEEGKEVQNINNLETGALRTLKAVNDETRAITYYVLPLDSDRTMRWQKLRRLTETPDAFREYLKKAKTRRIDSSGQDINFKIDANNLRIHKDVFLSFPAKLDGVDFDPEARNKWARVYSLASDGCLDYRVNGLNIGLQENQTNIIKYAKLAENDASFDEMIVTYGLETSIPNPEGWGLDDLRNYLENPLLLVLAGWRTHTLFAENRGGITYNKARLTEKHLIQIGSGIRLMISRLASRCETIMTDENRSKEEKGKAVIYYAYFWGLWQTLIPRDNFVKNTVIPESHDIAYLALSAINSIIQGKGEISLQEIMVDEIQDPELYDLVEVVANKKEAAQVERERKERIKFRGY